MVSELAFSDLNPYSGVEYLVGKTPEDLKAQIKSIRSPIKILSMYANGDDHYVWFLSGVKINKIKKGNKNGNSSKI